MADSTKADISHVEHLEDGGATPNKGKVMGTVKLTEGKIVYIPTPTADPRGERSPVFPGEDAEFGRPPQYGNVAKVDCACGDLHL